MSVDKIAKLKVNVKVKDSEISIPCGDGKQNFKWLALVIQERIKSDSSLLKKYDTASLIVSEIRNIFGELLNPNDLIVEHFGPTGLSVTAVLSSKFPLDQWETPEIGHWYKSAYVKSSTGKYWNSELDAWRATVKNEMDSSKKKEEVRRTTFIQVGFDFSAEDVSAAFDFDTKKMQWEWLLAESVEVNMSKLMDVLKSHYLLICNIFAHFCGFGQGSLDCNVSFVFFQKTVPRLFSWRKVWTFLVGIRSFLALLKNFPFRNGF